MSKIKSSLFYPALILGYTLLPLSGNAQTALNQIIRDVSNTLNIIIGLLFVLATLIFLWGVIKFISKETPEEKTKAKGIMTWGIIGLAVMAAAWGIVQVLITYFGVRPGSEVIPLGPRRGGTGPLD